ncbi:hypothetical protein F4825DRAFT_473936 [Nemania diffusa]|nr:hypothetical protein F4825DRAFT_473936 [Nemania diffusa]
MRAFSLLIHLSSNGNTSVCEPECSNPTVLPDGSYISVWIWAGADDSGNVEFIHTTTQSGEKTIVTVINTDLGITKTITSYPSDYTPPPPVPTNSDGTVISVVSYTRFGQVTTTTVTFPNGLVDWPESYAWSGVLSSNAPGCSPSTGTATLFSNPQFSTGLGLASSDWSSNPKGIGYSLIPGEWDDTLLAGFKDLFPDQPAFQCASNEDGSGPNFGDYTLTSWYTITSTSFEGTTASPTGASPGATVSTTGASPGSTGITSSPAPTGNPTGSGEASPSTTSGTPVTRRMRFRDAALKAILVVLLHMSTRL